MKIDAASVLALSVAIDRDVSHALSAAVAELRDLKAAVSREGLGEDLRLPTGESVRSIVRDHIDTLTALSAERERNMQRVLDIRDVLLHAGDYLELFNGVLAALLPLR